MIGSKPQNLQLCTGSALSPGSHVCQEVTSQELVFLCGSDYRPDYLEDIRAPSFSFVNTCSLSLLLLFTPPHFKAPHSESPFLATSNSLVVSWPHGLCSLPGSSVHWIYQARILEWVAIPGDLPTQRMNIGLLSCRWILYYWSTRETSSNQFSWDTMPRACSANLLG